MNENSRIKEGLRHHDEFVSGINDHHAEVEIILNSNLSEEEKNKKVSQLCGVCNGKANNQT